MSVAAKKEFALFVRGREGGTVYPQVNKWGQYGERSSNRGDIEALEMEFKQKNPGDPGWYYETEIREYEMPLFSEGEKVSISQMRTYNAGTLFDGKIQKITDKAFCVGVHNVRAKKSWYYWFPLKAVQNVTLGTIFLHKWVKITGKEVDWEEKAS